MTATLLPEDRVPQDPRGPLRDYVLRAYAPVCDPAGRLHASSVLRWFLRTCDLVGAWPIIQRCRRLLGPAETVWGVKLLPGGRAGLELYFYGDQGAAPRRAKRIEGLSEALEGLLAIDSQPVGIPYVMCSLELDAEVLATGRSPGWRIYIPGTRAAHGCDGLSYLVTADALVRENSYCFYYMPRELPAVVERARHSPRGGGDAAGLLPAAWTDCFTICYAVKAAADALYFSRLPTALAAAFLRRHWPGPLAELLSRYGEELAHLCWDVGHDFTASPTGEGAWSTTKVGLYGVI